MVSWLWGIVTVSAQELECKVTVNHSQVQGTNTSVFETLQTALNEFMNNRTWTDLQFGKVERISCTMLISVKTYDPNTNVFGAQCLFQLTRPVFNSSYNTTVFSMRDDNFNFTYKEYDPLEFNENNIDNDLTALMAYYAYLFIGMDLDTMSPLGGTEVLNRVETIVNSCQTMSQKGWKAFEDDRNRHAIINDYLESSMEPFRQMMYKYHREGLDEMANNVDRGRAEVSNALELLDEAHSNKPQSMLPQIFSDYKRDEIVNIYKGHGTDKEKEQVYDIVMNLNASQSREWDKIKKK
ncbi:MAG: DUF4835 family protein [Bacteroidaceae bacterium]|nr:DUF4835 family protein [Bacteroidaceae bacterium]